MTNTPMTSKEAFEKAFKNHKLDTFHPNGYPEQWEYKYKYVQHAWEGWQASQASQQSEIDALKYDLDGYMKIAHASATEIVQQAQTIAELKEDLLDLRTQVNYRCADVQRLTELNVELVEALDYIAETPIHPNIDVVGMFRNVARKAIAKVKGK